MSRLEALFCIFINPMCHNYLLIDYGFVTVGFFPDNEECSSPIILHILLEPLLCDSYHCFYALQQVIPIAE